jgi:imidazolonepropionase
VVPGFVDSHTHLVFGGARAEEFAARMAGSAYAAGGITTTVAATRAASDDVLRARAGHLYDELRRQGTTTVEIKSGYGLTSHDEARCLRIAGEFTDEVTFLGAHLVPPEFEDDPDAYVEAVTGPMLDTCAPLARWIDVFVEEGAFDADHARAILTAGRDRGPRLRRGPHGPQLHARHHIGA